MPYRVRKPRVKEWEDYPLILNPADAMDILRISRPTVFRWLKANTLPGASKVGGRWKIDKNTLRASITSKAIPTKR